MPITAAAVAPPEALAALANAVHEAKGDDALAPVTVVVPTNTCGVMARRALGRQRGVAGVDMVTLNRLAELIAGPALAAERRTPASTPVVDLAVRNVLDRYPGMYEPVAGHPSTTVALRDLHLELRLAGRAAATRLGGSKRGREVVRVSRAVTSALSARWYDEADLFERATELVSAGRSPVAPGQLRHVIVYLPGELPGLAIEFVQALVTQAQVQVVVTATGDAFADADTSELLQALTGQLIVASDLAPPPAGVPERIVSTTDADDEVRIAVRAVLDAARGAGDEPPVPFHRIAVLWPNHRPYARLVEHHLTAAGVPWNGRSGTDVRERVAPRLLLDLLDIDRRGLRRRDLFELLADVPTRDADGAPLPTAEWERVSRAAGVSRDDDWAPRLGALERHERWGRSATELGGFVRDLRAVLGHPSATRSWWNWAVWCDEQLERWLGPGAVNRMSEPEYRAYEALGVSLERLRHLDSVGEPVTRHRFRTVLEAELDAAPPREGRVGAGVTVGSLASAAGLDVDVAVVLGGAEGVLPSSPRADPLLSDTERARAGLATSDHHARRMLHQLLVMVGVARTTITVPRGDLRATTELEVSRWVHRWDHAVQPQLVASHVAGLRDVDFPACPSEHRLRTRLRRVASVGRIDDEVIRGDVAFGRALTMAEAHAGDGLSEFDGDLSAHGVPPIDRAVSPTQIETWVSCPHAYFMRYLLGVYPIDEPGSDIAINALDRGSLQHDVLDLFHRDVIERRLPQPGPDGWTETHREALLAHFDEVCALTERRGRTGRPASWADERARMRDDLLGWFEHDSELLVARGATVVASERRFGADDGVSLPLRGGRRLAVAGAIDRIDRAADGSLIVTDHKTGKADAYKKLTADDPTLDGSVFQLPAYAAAAATLVGEPDADVRAEYGMFARGRYGRHGYRFTPEVWAEVSDRLSHVVDGVEQGWFPARPERPGFRMWVGCRYCEPDGLGTDVPYERWQRKQHDPRIAPWFGAPDDAPAADADATGEVTR